MKLDLLGANLLGFGLSVETGKLYLNVEGGRLEEGLSLHFPKVKEVSFFGEVGEVPRPIKSQSLVCHGDLIHHKISTDQFSIEFKSSTVQRNSLHW